jgi:hypothetical protein
METEKKILEQQDSESNKQADIDAILQQIASESIEEESNCHGGTTGCIKAN